MFFFHHPGYSRMFFHRILFQQRKNMVTEDCEIWMIWGSPKCPASRAKTTHKNPQANTHHLHIKPWDIHGFGWSKLGRFWNVWHEEFIWSPSIFETHQLGNPGDSDLVVMRLPMHSVHFQWKCVMNVLKLCASFASLWNTSHISPQGNQDMMTWLPTRQRWLTQWLVPLGRNVARRPGFSGGFIHFSVRGKLLGGSLVHEDIWKIYEHLLF